MGCYELKQDRTANLRQGWTLEVSSCCLLGQIGVQMTLQTPSCFDASRCIIFFLNGDHISATHDAVSKLLTHLLGFTTQDKPRGIPTKHRVPLNSFSLIYWFCNSRGLPTAGSFFRLALIQDLGHETFDTMFGISNLNEEGFYG